MRDTGGSSSTEKRQIRELLENGQLVYTRAVVYFYDYDGSSLGSETIYTEDFRATGNSFAQSSGSGLPLGRVLSASVVLTISNQREEWSDYNWNNAQIRLFCDYYVNGNRRNMPTIGEYYVSSVRYVQSAIEITAYDMAYFFNTPFYINNRTPSSDNPRFATLWDYFVYLCDDVIASKMNITLSSNRHMYASHLNTDRFPNSDFALNAIAYDANANTTLRDILGYIAQLACGNIVIVWDSSQAMFVLDIITYDLSHADYIYYNGMMFGDTVETTYNGGVFGENVTATLDGGEITENTAEVFTLSKYTNPPTLEYSDVMYTGVKMTYPIVNSEANTVPVTASGLTNNSNVIELNNPLCERTINNRTEGIQTCVQNIYNAVCEKPIRPFEGSFSSNPLIEFMDNVIIVDGWGNAYNSFVTEHTYNYLGTSEISNKLPTTANQNNIFFR